MCATYGCTRTADNKVCDKYGGKSTADNDLLGRPLSPAGCRPADGEREFFIENLLVRIHFIIEMIWWTGLAPWEFEFSFPGSLRMNKRGSIHCPWD